MTATSPLVPLAHGVGPVLLKGSHEFYIKLNSHTQKIPPQIDFQKPDEVLAVDNHYKD